jgi:hypothetical protein
MLWKISKAGSRILNLTKYTLDLAEKGLHRNALASLICSSHALHIVGDDKGLSLWLKHLKKSNFMSAPKFVERSWQLH